MKTFFLVSFIFFTITVQAQSPCDKVLLYDQMVVKGDQPMLHKLKRFDIKLIPDTSLLKMKNEIIKVTSTEFFSELKIKSAKIFDSTVAKSWSWINPPITDKYSNPVYYFYAVMFETKTANGTPFVFRLDVLKNGELLNEKQIAFFRKQKLNIIGCQKLITLVLADTIQPIHAIDEIALAYRPNDDAIVWTVASVEDPKTGIQYYKEVNAITGTVIRRSSSDLNAVPETEIIEKVKTQTKN
jgi:hypothetical protein